MGSSFKAASMEVVHFALLHGAAFLFGFGLVVPSQGTYGPPAECAADYSVYATIGTLDFFLSIGILASYYVAAMVRSEVAAADGGLEGVGAGRKKRLRVLMLAALALSIASTAVALAVTTFILQVKVSVMRCWTSTMTAGVFTSLALAALICGYIYRSLVLVALYEN